MSGTDLTAVLKRLNGRDVYQHALSLSGKVMFAQWLVMLAAETRISPRPPRRSWRALLTHRVPPSGFGVEAVAR